MDRKDKKRDGERSSLRLSLRKSQCDQMWRNFAIWATFFQFGKNIFEDYLLVGKILGDFFAMGIFFENFGEF